MNDREGGFSPREGTERYLLAAVDESANSRRAVMYLADFFSNVPDVYITLLTILPEPAEDYFPTKVERDRWIEGKRAFLDKVLADYKAILLDAGFAEERLGTRLIMRECESVANVILEEQEKLRCCIVVVGRRGISHQEEFVFGSTSSKILHCAKNCAVLVVE